MIYQVIFVLAALASATATARYSKFDVKRDSASSKTVDGTVVGAKFDCLGYLCPKWRLLVSRFDVLRKVGEQFEFNLAELLPYAPTRDRSANLWTAYNPVNRHYTVAVQDYPVTGVDSFFVVEINKDVTSSTPIYTNVLIGHPDGAPGNPGKMAFSRIMYDANGNHLALFKDGRLFSLDLASKTYKLLADITPEGVQSGVPSNACVIDGTTLKTIHYDSASNVAYLVKTDLTTNTVSAPVALQPIKGMLGAEKPIAAHQLKDFNAGTYNLGVVYAGNFDQILTVDEATGVQTPIYSDLYNQPTTPSEFQCTTSTKDCDTLWATTAYDDKNGVLYFQSHYVEEDMSTAYIYELGYVQKKVGTKYDPYVNYEVMMTFGYYGYQWVQFQQ